jgi:cell division protein FtsB
MRSTVGRASRSAGRRPVNVTGAASASSNWLRSIRFSGFTVLMFVVLVLFVVIVAPGARIFIEQRQQIADLQQNLSAAEAQNSALTAEVARWSDPAYIRTEARDRLYYVMPGETSFLLLDDTGGEAAPAAAPVSSGIQATPSDWIAALLSSGMTAGWLR